MLLMEFPMTRPKQLRKRVANTLFAIILPAGAALGVPLMARSVASAQAYPTKLIKVICPYPSGSVVDVMARLVAPDLSSRLRKPVIVDNRPGGGGTIGTKEVARAAPDGYTLLFKGESHLFASKALDYDPIKDFVPIAMVATHP